MPAPVRKKKKVEARSSCIACNGTGVASSGSRCIPCNGRGVTKELKVWTCPDCGAVHRGFVNDYCHNNKCPSKHAETKTPGPSATKKAFSKKKATLKAKSPIRKGSPKPVSIGEEMDLD